MENFDLVCTSTFLGEAEMDSLVLVLNFGMETKIS